MNDQRRIRRDTASPDVGSTYQYHFGRELQARIGRALRELHAGVLRDDVPDAFTALLARLDEADRRARG